jgi:hypothetical protein
MTDARPTIDPEALARARQLIAHANAIAEIDAALALLPAEAAGFLLECRATLLAHADHLAGSTPGCPTMCRPRAHPTTPSSSRR